MFATLNHHQPHNRKTEQWQITRAFLVRLAISMHCCANDGGKIFGRKSIFVSRLTTWLLLQIYNMKQTTLSLTFPSVLFKFFSSKGKTAMFSCFQTALSQNGWHGGHRPVCIQTVESDQEKDKCEPFSEQPKQETKNRRGGPKEKKWSEKSEKPSAQSERTWDCPAFCPDEKNSSESSEAAVR